MIKELFGKNIFGEVVSFAILAAVFTAVLMYMPTYPETDFWGKFANNFLYFIAFYIAARWAFTIQKGVLK
jgi:hypothetical protein